jgi:predicted permease
MPDMSAPRRFARRLLALVRHAREEAELAREVHAHLALLAEQFERQGMSPDDASRAARRAFGGVEQAKEHQRDARGFRWIDDLHRDLRYAWRNLGRSPLFAVMAVLTLAVGIGLNTIVFTVADTVLHRGFPLVERNDRLVYITSGVGCCVSLPDFDDWRRQSRSFTAMALVHGLPTTLTTGAGYPERIDITEVTAGTFALVGQQPALGRDFTEADERPGAEPVAILRHGAWERRFGKDPSILGRVIRLDGVPTTIVGVMPPGFSFPQNQEAWVPLVRTPDVLRRDNRNTWFVVGRLRDDASLEGARAEMATIGRRLGMAYPLTNQGRNLVPYVEDFEGFFIGTRAATTYRAMIAAVVLVLLIACANLANLLLARTLGRARELSVRMAIGAGRSRVVRQMLAESLMITALGACGGWLLARWGVQAYVLVAMGAGISDQTLGTWFDDVLEYAIDYRAFAFLSAVSVLSGALFGLAPALRAARVELIRALNEGGRDGGNARAYRFTHILVAGQVALALVLLGGAAGMVKSLIAAMRPSATFSAEGIIAARLELPAARYADNAARVRFQDALRTQAAAMTGVERVALSSTLPATLLGGRRPFESEGTPIPDAAERPTAIVQAVSDGYFSTLRLPLLDGRDFDSRERSDGPPVAIVSRQFASQQWRGKAVGKRLRLFTADRASEPITVIAVAPDIVGSREQRPEPVIFVPQSQAPSTSMWLLVQTGNAAVSVSQSLRDALTRVDASLPIVDGPVPLADRLARGYRYRAVMAGLFAIFAVIALLLASMGLYAVVAQVVRSRTREIGVRSALGARAGQILQIVLTDALRSVAAGAAVGLAVWLSFGQMIGRTVREWSPDAADVLIAAGILAIAAIIGCVIPARRALSIDPGQALRPES